MFLLFVATHVVLIGAGIVLGWSDWHAAGGSIRQSFSTSQTHLGVIATLLLLALAGPRWALVGDTLALVAPIEEGGRVRLMYRTTPSGGKGVFPVPSEATRNHAPQAGPCSEESSSAPGRPF